MKDWTSGEHIGLFSDLLGRIPEEIILERTGVQEGRLVFRDYLIHSNEQIKRNQAWIYSGQQRSTMT